MVEERYGWKLVVNEEEFKVQYCPSFTRLYTNSWKLR